MKLGKSILEIQKRQKQIAAIVIGIAAVLVVVVTNPFGGEGTKVSKKKPSADVPFFMDNPNDLSVSRLMIDVDQLSEEKRQLEKSLQSQSKEVDGLRAQLDALAANVSKQAEMEQMRAMDGETALRAVMEMQEQCTNDLAQLQSGSGLPYVGSQCEIPETYQESPSSQQPTASWVENYVPVDQESSSPWTIDLTTAYGHQLGSEVTSVDNGVIAGTTVKAMLENGIIASFHPCAAEDPVFVKLRVMDESCLPKGLRTNMKDAYLIGAAYGDLSTERVRIRVEKLVVFRHDGTSLETEVCGVVTDECGQTGLAGRIVDRSPKILKNAAFAGLLEGTSNFLTATVNSQNLADATRGLPNGTRWDILQEGCWNGCSSAMERIGDYYAYLLENYHPYISICSGRTVDVTFLATSRFGSTDVYLECAEARSRGSQQVAQKQPARSRGPTKESEQAIGEAKETANNLLRAYGLEA